METVTLLHVLQVLVSHRAALVLSFQLIQTNKLKHYSSIHGDFSSEFRQPCVVFTGHPSLRFGDVVHFMELWGKSSLNTIIFTGNYNRLPAPDRTQMPHIQKLL